MCRAGADLLAFDAAFLAVVVVDFSCSGVCGDADEDDDDDANRPKKLRSAPPTPSVPSFFGQRDGATGRVCSSSTLAPLNALVETVGDDAWSITDCSVVDRESM